MPNPQPEFYGGAPARRADRARWLGKDGVPVGFMARFNQVPFWKFALFMAAWLLVFPWVFIVVGIVLPGVFDPPEGAVYDALIVCVDVAIVAWAFITAVCKALDYRPGGQTIGGDRAGWEARSAGARNAGRPRAGWRVAGRLLRAWFFGLMLFLCLLVVAYLVVPL